MVHVHNLISTTQNNTIAYYYVFLSDISMSLVFNQRFGSVVGSILRGYVQPVYTQTLSVYPLKMELATVPKRWEKHWRH